MTGRRRRGPRVPSMQVVDPERDALLAKLAELRRAYLAEFADDGGDELTLISWVISGLARLRDEELRG